MKSLNAKIIWLVAIGIAILLLLWWCVSLYWSPYRSFSSSGINYDFVKVDPYALPSDPMQQVATSGDDVALYHIDDTLLGIKFVYKQLILGEEKDIVWMRVRRDHINDIPYIFVNSLKIGKMTADQFRSASKTWCQLVKALSFRGMYPRFDKGNISVFMYDLNPYWDPTKMQWKCFLTDFEMEFPYFIVDKLKPESVYFILSHEWRGGRVDESRVDTLEFYK